MSSSSPSLLTRREVFLVGATAFVTALIVAYVSRRTNFAEVMDPSLAQSGDGINKNNGMVMTETNDSTSDADNNNKSDNENDQCIRRWLGEEESNGVGGCKPWCSEREHDAFVCEWKDCVGCSFCEKEEVEFCPDWCNYKSKPYDHGLLCNYDWAANCSSCGCATFVDVTKYKLPRTDHYFHQWFHSGKPYSHENGPIFVDLNGDGILDYFDTMHAHPLPINNATMIHGSRFELTESVPYDFVADGIILPDDMKDLDDNMYRYRHVGYRIHIEEARLVDLDPHGQNILDLDGDGLLDMMISSGGSRGMINIKYAYAHSRNNFLLWGEKDVDQVTGNPTTIFRGGRDTSEAAGVHMEYGRGRVNYMMDINHDGLIDIFCLQVRPVNNLLIPGVMLLNQGNRTWSQDLNMQEYTEAMILTDADGDGLAQELVVARSFCYPERKGPEVDPKYKKYGPYTEEVKKFCRTRPVGTMAVYKYNKATHTMVEISPKETTTPEANQPCGKDCHHPGKTLVSGDFDGDLIADLVVMYNTRLEFFLSSDRKKGEDDVGYNKEPSSVLEYTDDKCIHGQVIRLVDIDNDGRQEILVACSRPGWFRLFTRGEDKDVWHQESPCSADGALGDLVNATLVKPTESDLGHLCNCLSHQCSKWAHAKEGCEYYKNRTTTKLHLQLTALSPVDLNNDGFVDIVATYNFGYTHFFHNVPRMAARRNRFITFQLVGGPRAGNVYGIGATVILYGERRRQRQTTITQSGDNNNNSDDDGSSSSSTTTTPYHQFREKSTHQHATDGYGSLDERITFGLGIDIYPLNVTVRWSNGHMTVMDLTSSWTFEPKTYPIVIGE